VHELGDTILLPDDGVSFESTGACFGMISGKEHVLARWGRAGETGKGRVSARPGWAGEISTTAFGIEEGFRRTRGAAPTSDEVIAIVPQILKIVPPRRQDRGGVPQELHIQILHEGEIGEKG